HLHMSVSSATGEVRGGHVVAGNRVRTTVEVLLAPTSGWRLTRAPDDATGHPELMVHPSAERTPSSLVPSRPILL
ncbi:MAG TPA: DUF296 domain-containing protein, partial [Variovorax sp.]|nr:DUF296 domain-containing protein [Variovorax sp.]